MSSPVVRIPYCSSLWSLLLKGLSRQADWLETWATLLHEAQLKNISDSELLIEIQVLRNSQLLLVLPPMAPPLDNFLLVMIERDLQTPLIESERFSRVPISKKLQPNFVFLVDGRVRKDVKINVQSFIKLDYDKLQYKIKLESLMPQWFKNLMKMQRNCDGWIDDYVEDREDRLTKSERSMKILCWHVRGVKTVGFKIIFKQLTVSSTHLSLENF